MGGKKPFDGKRWGMFTHYLATPAGLGTGEYPTVEEWNRKIDDFDEKILAKQLHEVGTDYFCITIGQNSGHYISPNSAYDRLTGITPSKCTKRDLIADIADELEKYNIDLYVYLPSGAPCSDKEAMEALEWEWGFDCEMGEWSGPRTGKRLANFQRKWEEIIREWSVRWGDKVKGWWIDGCYFIDEMYRFSDAPNFESLAAAIRSGNPDAAIAFNEGLDNPFKLHSDFDNFTAGEVGEKLPIPSDGASEKLGDDKRLHVLSYLGKTWSMGEPRFSDELAVGYSKLIVEKGGVITWDVRLENGGAIPESFIEQMKKINEGLK